MLEGWLLRDMKKTLAPSQIAIMRLLRHENMVRQVAFTLSLPTAISYGSSDRCYDVFIEAGQLGAVQ